MDKLNRSQRAVKGTITKLETFVEESSNRTPTKLDIKLKRVQEMNKKIDELKDQYYETKDISDGELAEIEADLQEMEYRLEDLEVRIRDILNSLIAKSSVSSVHSCENEISQANSKQKLEIKLPEIPLPVFRGEIDLLIRCELFFELLRPNQLRSPCEKWLLQETVFGYIVVGSSDKFEEKSYCGLAINSKINSDSLNQQLRAFWEIETADESPKEYILEEEICETQYQNTPYRNEEGRYVVQFPFKRDPNCLDDLWKDSADGPVKTYKLNTVTYGTTCSPYLLPDYSAIS
ncbi:integrase catalytic domain-containing protein [Trichonephila clavata]|uniref:Integrase catalytic domain-containing protein n=1 Tax=Trichonephila clavata TaxID=2740835 RepID=A0A8X6LA28_TRICU|nr:integrase catalytic domain-containing protein [Trichonephila clavata]